MTKKLLLVFSLLLSGFLSLIHTGIDNGQNIWAAENPNVATKNNLAQTPLRVKKKQAKAKKIAVIEAKKDTLACINSNYEYYCLELAKDRFLFFTDFDKAVAAYAKNDTLIVKQDSFVATMAQQQSAMIGDKWLLVLGKKPPARVYQKWPIRGVEKSVIYALNAERNRHCSINTTSCYLNIDTNVLSIILKEGKQRAIPDSVDLLLIDQTAPLKSTIVTQKLVYSRWNNRLLSRLAFYPNTPIILAIAGGQVYQVNSIRSHIWEKWDFWLTSAVALTMLIFLVFKVRRVFIKRKNRKYTTITPDLSIKKIGVSAPVQEEATFDSRFEISLQQIVSELGQGHIGKEGKPTTLIRSMFDMLLPKPEKDDSKDVDTAKNYRKPTSTPLVSSPDTVTLCSEYFFASGSRKMIEGSREFNGWYRFVNIDKYSIIVTPCTEEYAQIAILKNTQGLFAAPNTRLLTASEENRRFMLMFYDAALFDETSVAFRSLCQVKMVDVDGEKKIITVSHYGEVRKKDESILKNGHDFDAPGEIIRLRKQLSDLGEAFREEKYKSDNQFNSAVSLLENLQQKQREQDNNISINDKKMTRVEDATRKFIAMVKELRQIYLSTAHNGESKVTEELKNSPAETDGWRENQLESLENDVGNLRDNFEALNKKMDAILQEFLLITSVKPENTANKNGEFVGENTTYPTAPRPQTINVHEPVPVSEPDAEVFEDYMAFLTKNGIILSSAYHSNLEKLHDALIAAGKNTKYVTLDDKNDKITYTVLTSSSSASAQMVFVMVTNNDTSACLFTTIGVLDDLPISDYLRRVILQKVKTRNVTFSIVSNFVHCSIDQVEHTLKPQSYFNITAT